MAVVADGTIVVDADGDPFLRSLDRIARKGERRMTKAGSDFGSNFGKSMGRGLTNTMGGISKLLTVAGAAGPAVMALGGALSATAAAATTLSAAIGPPLAAAVAASAGTMLAAGQGAIFAKIAFKGMGDAIGGDAEALKKFDPEGRKLIKTLQGTSKELDGVRKSVQGGLFPGLERAVSSLATSYFPLLNTAGEQTGTVLGRLAEQGAAMLTSGPWKADFATLTKANADNLGVLGTTVFNLLDIIRNLLVTSAPLTKRFLDWAAGASASVAALTESGRQTGELAAWFQRAGDMAATWGRILGNLGSALSNVFAASDSGGSADAMLVKLEELTQKWEEWTGSVDGNAAIAKWFQSGQENLEAMGRLVGDLSAGLSGIGGGAKLAPLLDQINALVVPPLLELLTNASASGALDSMVAALGSILEVLSGLASNGSFTAFAETIKAVADAAGWVLTNVPGAGTAMAGLLTVMGGFAALKMVGLGPAIMAVTSGLSGLVAKMAASTGIIAANTAAVNTNSLSYRLLHGPMMTTLAAKAREAVAWVASKAAMIASAVATKAVTAAQWLLNAALTANPIGLVIAAIAGLVAGLYILYQKNDSFRELVQKVWSAIKGAIGATVDWITGTVWPAIQQVWSSISSGAQTLWGWMKTAWDGIKSAIASVWSFIQPIFGLWEWYFGMLGTAFTFFKDIAVMVWQIIGVLFQAGWVGLKVVFDAISDALGWVGDKFGVFKDAVSFAWDSLKGYLKAGWDWLVATVWDPVAAKLAWVKGKFDLFKIGVGLAWDWIKEKLSAGWNWIRDNVFAFFERRLVVLKQNFDLMKTGIGLAWDWVKTKLQAGWDWIRVNVFDKFKAGLDSLKSKFETVRDGIGNAWDKLKELAKAPIKFIINTVLNDGLIGAFNKLAVLVGSKGVDPIRIAGFKSGGVLPGYTPGRDVHKFWSPTAGWLGLSGGEGILIPQITRALGGAKGIARLNRGDLSGLGFAKGGVFPGGVSGHAFAGGGVIDWIKGKAGDAWGWVTDKASEMYKAFTSPVDYLKNFIKSKVDSIPGAGKIVDYGKSAINMGVGWVAKKIKEIWETFKSAFDKVQAESSAGIGPSKGHALSRVMAALLPGLTITNSYRNPEHNARVGGRAGSLHMDRSNPAVDIGGPTSQLDAMYRKLVAMGGWRELLWRVAGHYDHVHVAKDGGVLPRPLLFDRGGVLPQGTSLVHNGTGAPERLARVGNEGMTVRLSDEDVERIAQAVYRGARDGFSGLAARSKTFAPVGSRGF